MRRILVGSMGRAELGSDREEGEGLRTTGVRRSLTYVDLGHGVPYRTSLLRACVVLLAITAMCVSAWVPVASAYDPVDRFSLNATVGLSFPSMGNVNGEIRDGNRFLGERDWLTLDRIETQFNFNYGLRANLFGPWNLEIGGGRVTGETGVDFDQVIKVRPMGNYFAGRVVYELPFRPRENIRFFAGGGPVFFTTMELEVSHEQRDVEGGTQRIETLTLDSSAAGFLLVLEGEVILSEKTTFVTDFAFRSAKVTYGESDASWKIDRLRTAPGFDSDGDGIPDSEDLSDDSYFRSAFASENIGRDGDINRTLVNPDMENDFTGFVANVGLRFYLF